MLAISETAIITLSDPLAGIDVEECNQNSCATGMKCNECKHIGSHSLHFMQLQVVAVIFGGGG